MITRTRKPLIAAAALTAGLTALLAGCTAAPEDAKPSPAASEPADAAATPSFNECIDGQAVIAPANGETAVELPDGCEAVYIIANDITVTVGPTSKIGFEGTGNTVTYTGDTAPEVIGAVEGDGNTVTPAS